MHEIELKSDWLYREIESTRQDVLTWPAKWRGMLIMNTEESLSQLLDCATEKLARISRRCDYLETYLDEYRKSISDGDETDLRSVLYWIPVRRRLPDEEIVVLARNNSETVVHFETATLGTPFLVARWI